MIISHCTHQVPTTSDGGTEGCLEGIVAILRARLLVLIRIALRVTAAVSLGRPEDAAHAGVTRVAEGAAVPVVAWAQEEEGAR